VVSKRKGRGVHFFWQAASSASKIVGLVVLARHMKKPATADHATKNDKNSAPRFLTMNALRRWFMYGRQNVRGPRRHVLCGLTFELTGPLRRDGLARAGKMYRVPQTGPRQPAVGGPVVQRGVRRRRGRAGSLTLILVLEPVPQVLSMQVRQ
jgi:hypothetical protein